MESSPGSVLPPPPIKSIVVSKRQSYRPPSFEAPSKWVAIQLSPVGEREKDLALLVKALHKLLRKPPGFFEVFIPAISQKIRDESETMYFMEGYIFVKHIPDTQYLKLQDTTFFTSVLCRMALVNGRRQQQYSLLSDDDLKVVRNGVQNLRVAEYSINDIVKIIKGNYKNLTGEISVVYEDGQHVQVAVNYLRSKKVLIDYPVTYLVKI